MSSSMFSSLVFSIILIVSCLNADQCNNSSSSSACRLNHAGIYYIYLKSSNYSYYELVSLNSDGSAIILGSDQQSAAASKTKIAAVQPYSNILAKWKCQTHTHTTEIMISGYNFVYQTKALKSYAVVEKYTLLLNDNSTEIEGQQKFTFVNLNVTQGFKQTKNSKRTICIRYQWLPSRKIL